MEEWDLYYVFVLGVCKCIVLGVVFVVMFVFEDVWDIKIVDDVCQMFVEYDDFFELVEDMLDVLGKGFFVIEIDWFKIKICWLLCCFVYRDLCFFMFDCEIGFELCLIDECDMVDGLFLVFYKWIYYCVKLKFGLIGCGGLVCFVVFGWMCKSYMMKDWIVFIEIYGLFLCLGCYGKDVIVDDVEVFFMVVVNIGMDVVVVLFDNMNVDFEQIVVGSGNDIFENFVCWVDEQIFKVVLG